MKQWIVSYGTLGNKKITEKTGDSFEYIPCRIEDHIRRWSFPIPKQQRSAAGIEYEKNAYTTGTLVSILEKDFSLFDKREVGYLRHKIEDTSILKPMDGKMPDGEFWMYIPIAPKVPTTKTPITQTMVDVIIDACMSISESFAKECILTTNDWQYPWVNDRSKPLYPRHLSGLSTFKIDKILKECIPEHFSNRIEENI
mgnify:CR=1 FL=1